MRRTLGLVLAVAATLWSAIAVAQTGEAPRVDVALVLTVDASGSIDTPEFQLQKEGIAGAVADPEVLSTIQSGRNGRIAIAYVEWGAPGGAQMMVDWMLVGDAASAAAFGNAVLQAPRSIQSYNAIGDAIDLAVRLFDACPCQPTRRIIDVSGDNPDNRSHHPGPLARDAAVATGHHHQRARHRAGRTARRRAASPGWSRPMNGQLSADSRLSPSPPTPGPTLPGPCAKRWYLEISEAYCRPGREIWPRSPH